MFVACWYMLLRLTESNMPTGSESYPYVSMRAFLTASGRRSFGQNTDLWLLVDPPVCSCLPLDFSSFFRRLALSIDGVKVHVSAGWPPRPCTKMILPTYVSTEKERRRGCLLCDRPLVHTATRIKYSEAVAPDTNLVRHGRRLTLAKGWLVQQPEEKVRSMERKAALEGEPTHKRVIVIVLRLKLRNITRAALAALRVIGRDFPAAIGKFQDVCQ
jgi:hypothetical protein